MYEDDYKASWLDSETVSRSKAYWTSAGAAVVEHKNKRKTPQQVTGYNTEKGNLNTVVVNETVSSTHAHDNVKAGTDTEHFTQANVSVNAFQLKQNKLSQQRIDILFKNPPHVLNSQPVDQGNSQIASQHVDKVITEVIASSIEGYCAIAEQSVTPLIPKSVKNTVQTNQLNQLNCDQDLRPKTNTNANTQVLNATSGGKDNNCNLKKGNDSKAKNEVFNQEELCRGTVAQQRPRMNNRQEPVPETTQSELE